MQTLSLSLSILPYSISSCLYISLSLSSCLYLSLSSSLYLSLSLSLFLPISLSLFRSPFPHKMKLSCFEIAIIATTKPWKAHQTHAINIAFGMMMKHFVYIELYINVMHSKLFLALENGFDAIRETLLHWVTNELLEMHGKSLELYMCIYALHVCFWVI